MGYMPLSGYFRCAPLTNRARINLVRRRCLLCRAPGRRELDRSKVGSDEACRGGQSLPDVTSSIRREEARTSGTITNLASLLFLGFFLGMRHATDADHVVAIATIVSRQRTLRGSALIGGAWASDTLTILVVGSAIILFGVVIPARVGLAMELAVGIMLVLLGLLTLTGLGRVIREAAGCHAGGAVLRSAHGHGHDGISHDYLHDHAHAHGDYATSMRMGTAPKATVTATTKHRSPGSTVGWGA